MKKLKLLLMSGFVVLSGAAQNVLAQQNSSSPPSSQTQKPPFATSPSGFFSYGVKTPRGENLRMEVTWEVSKSQPSKESVRISGAVKYKNPATGKLESLQIDENKSYIDHSGRLYFALPTISERVFGPVELSAVESARRKKADETAKEGAPDPVKSDLATADDNKPLKVSEANKPAAPPAAQANDAMLDNPASAAEADEEMDESFEDDDSFSQTDRKDASALEKKYPKSGSFDAIVRAGAMGVLPVSVVWTINGPVKNNHAKIKGHIKWVDQGRVFSFALDANKSYMKNGKIYFSSPRWGGPFVSPTGVNTQHNRVLAVKKAVKNILANKGRNPPALKKPYQAVDPLSGALYAALLNYGVENVKYGRSDYSNYIRAWLTKALNPDDTSWSMSARVVSVLHQLGVNVDRGNALKVALRPIEKLAKRSAMAGGMLTPMSNPDPRLPFMVANVEDLANLLDYPIGRFIGRANEAFDRLRRRGAPRTAQDVLNELGFVREQENVAATVVVALGQPGILALTGLDINQQRELAQAIIVFWEVLTRNPGLTQVAGDILAEHLRTLMGGNSNREHRAADLIVDRLRQAPVRTRAAALFNIQMMIGIHNAARDIPDVGSSINAGMSSFGIDRSRRDEF